VPGRSARGRLGAVAFWVVAAEVTTAAGAAFGSAVAGPNSLLLIPWLAPGIVLLLIALERIERYRRREFGIWSGKLLALAFFLPALALGSGIQEAVGR
jgi:hypothetical protein